MSGDVETIVESTVVGLGYDFVDFERSARGLLRVFIDKAGGISVEDCANASNQLSRVFAVEGIDFERLEVSSPGLDRSLRRLKDFQQFLGRSAKVKLHAAIDNRKRFDGVIDSVDASGIAFTLIDSIAPAVSARAGPSKRAGKLIVSGKGKGNAELRTAKIIVVPLENIDRARLIPEF